MQELKEQELIQKENKFKTVYEKWKNEVRDIVLDLKENALSVTCIT